MARTWANVAAPCAWLLMGGGLGGRALCADLPAAEVKALRQFLQHAVDSGEDHPAEIEAQFAAAAVDLNGDGVAEYVVYLTGELWCRNAGCRAWVIAKQGAGFRVVSEIAPVQLPIAVLKDRLSGWRTLLVEVDSGRGMMPGYKAELRFDGKKYPGNPAVAPARPAAKGVAGQVLIEGEAMRYALFP